MDLHICSIFTKKFGSFKNASSLNISNLSMFNIKILEVNYAYQEVKNS